MPFRTSLIVAVAAAAAVSTAALAERGSDGHLNIIYWQAVATLNPYLSGGTKDVEAASLVLEPLALYDEHGDLVPVLAEEIPTVENGGVAADLLSITWKLKQGVMWSDGTELTAHDAVFSARFCMHEDAVCVPESDYDEVEAIEALDDYTVQFRFNIIQPYPYGFLVGSGSPILQMAQFQDCMGAAAAQCADQNFGPIGTGPFKVDGFVVNESVSYSANENYRDPDKPAFATVTLTGGGDAVSAARSVLETGEADYAWNVQVAPEVPGADVGRRRGRRGRRVRCQCGAPHHQPDQQRSGPRRRPPLPVPGRRQPASVPVRPGGAACAVARHRPPKSGRRGLRHRGTSHLQHPARAGEIRIDGERGVQDAEP